MEYSTLTKTYRCAEMEEIPKHTVQMGENINYKTEYIRLSYVCK